MYGKLATTLGKAAIGKKIYSAYDAEALTEINRAVASLAGAVRPTRSSSAGRRMTASELRESIERSRTPRTMHFGNGWDDSVGASRNAVNSTSRAASPAEISALQHSLKVAPRKIPDQIGIEWHHTGDRRNRTPFLNSDQSRSIQQYIDSNPYARKKLLYDLEKSRRTGSSIAASARRRIDEGEYPHHMIERLNDISGKAEYFIDALNGRQ